MIRAPATTLPAFIGAVVCALGVGFQSSPKLSTTATGKLQQPSQTAVIGGIALLLPPPMTAEDAQAWCEEFALPKATCGQLEVAVAEFVVQERTERARIFQRTIELAGSLPSVPEIYNSAAALDPLRELVRERDRAVKRLFALEEQFFSALDSRLSSLNLEMIGDSLRQARRLARSREVRCRLPMAQLDLRGIIRAMRSGTESMIQDSAEWEAAISGYDHELAALHEKRTMRVFADILEDVEAFRAAGGDANALIEYRTQTLNERLRLERAIISANRRWAETLSHLMEPSSSRVFQSLVDAALYPAIYPDPMSLRPLFNRIASLPDQTDCKNCLERLSSEMAGTEALAKRMEPELTALAVSEARDIVSKDDRLRVEAMIDWLQSARYKAAVSCKESCSTAMEIARLPEWSQLLEACRSYESTKAAKEPSVQSGPTGTSPEGSRANDSNHP